MKKILLFALAATTLAISSCQTAAKKFEGDWVNTGDNKDSLLITTKGETFMVYHHGTTYQGTSWETVTDTLELYDTDNSILKFGYNSSNDEIVFAGMNEKVIYKRVVRK